MTVILRKTIQKQKQDITSWMIWMVRMIRMISSVACHLISCYKSNFQLIANSLTKEQPKRFRTFYLSMIFT